LVGLGLLAATIAWSALVVRVTVLDADRLADSAEELLGAEEVRDAVAGNLEDEIAPLLPAGTETPGFDDATDATIEDPQFVAAFSSALVTLHENVFAGSDAPLVLDSGAVGAASTNGLASVDPALAAQVPPGTRLDVPLTTVDPPDLSWVTTVVTLVMILGAVAAVGLLASGLATTPHRAVTLRRIGRFALVLAAVQLLVAVVVPSLLLLVLGSGWPEVGIRTWRAFAWGLVIPAMVLTVVGGGCVLGARALRRTTRSEPAAPSPGRVGSPPPAPAPSPAGPAPAAAPSRPAGSERERIRDWVWPDS